MAFADKEFFKHHYEAIETILKSNGVNKAYIAFDELTGVAKAIYVGGEEKSINPGLLVTSLRAFFVSKDTSYTLDVCGMTLFGQEILLPEGCILFSTFKTTKDPVKQETDNPAIQSSSSGESKKEQVKSFSR